MDSRIKNMYDLKDSNRNELSKFEEYNLKKDIESNRNLFRSNKDIYEENEYKFYTCSMYYPCPICHKCQNKASHLFVRCETCMIPLCNHKYENRTSMIKRENFSIRIIEDSGGETKGERRF